MNSAQSAPDIRMQDERTILELDTAWSKSASTRDSETCLSFLADDISLPFSNGPTLSGKESVRRWVKMVMANPGLDWRWQAQKVEVSRDGTMAYVTGTYQLSLKSGTGKQVTDRGKYLTVWRKEADGKWKAVVDTANTDLAPDEYVTFFAVFAAALSPTPQSTQRED